MEFVVIPLILFLLGSYGYEEEADRVAQVSTHTRNNKQIVEGISRFQFSETGRTRLMYAAMTGDLERLNFIADLGARVNMISWNVSTALHIACKHGHIKCVRSLINRGAIIEAEDRIRRTPLYRACEEGHLDVVQLLCGWGGGYPYDKIEISYCIDIASVGNHHLVSYYLNEVVCKGKLY